MRDYTKHRIWRIRDLNEKYFEVLFAKRDLNFVPGDAVTLYNGSDQPLFIASGMQEPWVRIIVDRDLFPNFDFEANNLKLDSEVKHLIPSLAAEESPNFILDPSCAAPFLSYSSTFPQVKSKVVYLGSDRINEDWINANHKIVTLKNARKLKDLYIMGNRDLMERKASKLLNTCKKSYLV